MKIFFNVFAIALTLGLFVACGNDKAASEGAEDAAADVASDVTGEPATSLNDEAAADPAVPAGPTTSIEYAETTFDFGEVTEGEKVRHVYKFTNTGNEPLIISNAKGSCGCTVPDWPREPIAVGEAGEIVVEFDTKGKGSAEGKPQTKRVTVTANTDPVNTFLTITGKVTKPAGAANPS
jgi:hypothetical protein